MTNRELASVFRHVADLLDFESEAGYKVAPYRKAATMLTTTKENVQDLWRTGRLDELPGITPTLAAEIDELERTGRLGFLEQLEAKVPSELPSLLATSGIDPKIAAILYNALGIKSFVDLEWAAKENKLAGVKGWGKVKKAYISWDIYSVYSRAVHRAAPYGNLLGSALEIARSLVAAIEAIPNSTISRVAVVGDIARGRETVREIELLVAADEPERALQACTKISMVTYTYDEQKTPYVTRVGLRNGFSARMRTIYPKQWASAYVVNTSDAQQRTALQEWLRYSGYIVKMNGILINGTPQQATDETDVYRQIALPFIPVEFREGASVLNSVAKGLNRRLVEVGDLRGDLHTHSAWSDGTYSIEAMAFAAARRGDAYMLLTDHSNGRGMMHGLNKENISQQRREIDAVNTKLANAGFGMQVLHGCEVDIGTEGDLDFDDAVLAQFDIVVAALHHTLRQPRDRITARMIQAMQNRNVNIIAHPTGRILNVGDPADLDMEQIAHAAADLGVILEINSNPERLDLKDIHIEMAMAAGCRFSIASDAHADWQLGWLELGVMTARRAALSPVQVVNTLPDVASLLKTVQRS